MRLQLRSRALAAALGVALAAGPARADWSASLDGRSSIYQDTDKTFISTTVVGARVSPRDVVSVSGHYLADIITSASVDVVTAATGAFHETRHEGAGAVAYADGTRTATVGYVYSVENDWRSHSASAGFSHDFWSHRLSLGLGGSFTHNDVGRSGGVDYRCEYALGAPDPINGITCRRDPNFHRNLDQGSASLDLGIVAGRRDLVTLDYTFLLLKGYQASPYRFVYIEDPSAKGQRIAGPENDPDLRVRHAVAVRWNHHAFGDTAIKSHLRLYGDDWGVYAATLGTEYVVGFAGDFEASVSVRGYAQTGAKFYQNVYDTRRRYMTADRELSPFVDAFGGLRLGWARARRAGIFEELRAEAKATGFAFHFFDFSRLENRFGILGEIALGGSI